MANRSESTNIIVVLLVILTFPLWFGILGGLFGIGAGLFSMVVGIFSAFFRVAAAIVQLPFRILFGWGDGYSFFHFNGFTVLVILVLVAILIRRKNQA